MCGLFLVVTSSSSTSSGRKIRFSRSMSITLALQQGDTVVMASHAALGGNPLGRASSAPVVSASDKARKMDEAFFVILPLDDIGRRWLASKPVIENRQLDRVVILVLFKRSSSSSHICGHGHFGTARSRRVSTTLARPEESRYRIWPSWRKSE